MNNDLIEVDMKDFEGISAEDLASISASYLSRSKVMRFFWFVFLILMIITMSDIVVNLLFFTSSLIAIFARSNFYKKHLVFKSAAFFKVVEGMNEEDAHEFLDQMLKDLQNMEDEDEHKQD